MALSTFSMAQKAPALTGKLTRSKTIPGKGWFVYIRLYGVQQAFFDKTWQLPLVEPVNFKNFAK